MEERVVKLGVVGLNRGLSVVSKVIKDDNVQLYAICDKNPERLERAKKQLARDYNLTDLLCFDSLEEFLASDVEAVFIATDATLHTPQVIQALEAGKHVISEIPTVNTIEEAKMLKAAVKAHPNQKYMVGENCCFWEFIEAWKRMYEDGKFGQCVYAESEYLHAHDIYKSPFQKPKDPNYWRTSYHAIKYLTHNLGPLLYILDDYCVSVTCMEPDVKYNPYKTGTETGVALFKTAKGAVIRILICFGAYVGEDHNFSLYGTKGSIDTDRSKSLWFAHSFAHLSDIPNSYANKIEIPVKLGNGEGHGGADPKMMRAFIKCIIDDTKPPVDVDLGIRMSIPGIIAHESAVQGGVPLEIPQID